MKVIKFVRRYKKEEIKAYIDHSEESSTTRRKGMSNQVIGKIRVLDLLLKLVQRARVIIYAVRKSK